MSFKEMLENMREEYVSLKNKEFHIVMKSIIDEAIKTIDIKLMKENIAKKVETNPEHNSYEESFKISLEPLFTEEYIWVDGKFVKNEKQPYIVWFDNIIYKCRKGNTNKEEFCDYLYESEPNIKRLRALFKEEFSEAMIKPWIFIHSGLECFIQISIIYDLKQPTSIINTTSKPFRKTKGDLVTW
jgi:hypothetical protein